MKLIKYIKNLFSLDNLIEKDLSEHRAYTTRYEDLCK
jgi:hypothetical protein